MRILILIIMILALCLIQASLLDYFAFFKIKPDLVLVSLVFISLRMSFSGWPLLLGLIAGLVKDAFGLGSFGLNSFLFPIWSFLILNLSRKVTLEDDFLPVLLVFIVALLHNLIEGLTSIYLGSVIPLGIFLRIIFLGSLYTALTLPLLAKLINPLLRISYSDKKDEPLNDY
jgi:rod shape-determining protein MreD